MNRMRMQDCWCCCSMMMAMTMKGSVHIIIGNKQAKRKKYENDSIYNSIDFKSWSEQQRLG